MEEYFFRTDLNGQKIPIPFTELHQILREVVYYFEVNLNESTNVLILPEVWKMECWKYLSISWVLPEVAESRRYTWLCERGCLALLNGISLDFITNQQRAGSEDWQRIKALASMSLPYLRLYQPSDDNLKAGREFLLNAFTFIAEMADVDLDDDGCPEFPIQTQAAWFTRNIVGDYFRSTAELDFG